MSKAGSLSFSSFSFVLLLGNIILSLCTYSSISNLHNPWNISKRKRKQIKSLTLLLDFLPHLWYYQECVLSYWHNSTKAQFCLIKRFLLDSHLECPWSKSIDPSAKSNLKITQSIWRMWKNSLWNLQALGTVLCKQCC